MILVRTGNVGAAAFGIDGGYSSWCMSKAALPLDMLDPWFVHVSSLSDQADFVNLSTVLYPLWRHCVTAIALGACRGLHSQVLGVRSIRGFMFLRDRIGEPL